MFASSNMLNASRNFYWKRKTIEEFLHFIDRTERYEHVLDAGCGIGFFTEILAENLDLASILGLDSNTASIEVAISRHAQCPQRDKITYRVGDLLSSGLEANSFDFVFAHYVLIDTLDADRVLSQLVHVTKPGGVLCCIEPIYQMDMLNCYLPFIENQDLEKLRRINRKIMIEIPKSQGIDRAIAPSLPKRFVDRGLESIEIKLHGDYTFSREFDEDTLQMIMRQSRQALASKEMLGRVIKQHPFLKYLSESDLDDCVETQIKLSQAMVRDPQELIASGMFTAGFNLMIRGRKP